MSQSAAQRHPLCLPDYVSPAVEKLDLWIFTYRYISESYKVGTGAFEYQEVGPIYLKH